MDFITTQDALEAFTSRAAKQSYITVDTEFIRENSYYAQLCLLQLAFEGEGNAAVIDVMSDQIDLKPVLSIFENPEIVKVFHAARQDLEIFLIDYNVLPRPFFDTQIAAMAAGFGEQVGYETLVRSIANGQIDKSNRFTDWSRRPLTDKQIEYAAADVTYLRDIYLHLNDSLNKNGRITWVQAEFESLLDEGLYRQDPFQAWQKIRTRNAKPKVLAYLRELAAFREEYARENNMLRGRVLKDDVLVELANQRPHSPQELKNLRLWNDKIKGPVADGVLAAIMRADGLDPKSYPRVQKRGASLSAPESVSDLLKVYLKAQSEQHEVASRLICSTSELEEFAADPENDSPLNRGWRYEVFGKDAKALINGEAGLIAKDKHVQLVRKDEL